MAADGKIVSIFKITFVIFFIWLSFNVIISWIAINSMPNANTPKNNESSIINTTVSSSSGTNNNTPSNTNTTVSNSTTVNGENVSSNISVNGVTVSSYNI